MLGRLLGSQWFLATGAILLILAALFRYVEIRTPNRPGGSWEQITELAEREDLNIVFVLIDTLRADRLSAYGYERPTSPILEGLVASGIRFDDAIAQSTWTKTSMASIWSSTYPATNRITRYPHGLPDEFPSPAELLRENGYRTVGMWRNGWVAPNFGFAQGFDYYFKPSVQGQRPHMRQDNPSAHRLPGTDFDLTMAATEFLGRAGDEKFFLYIHYMDVHQYVYDENSDFGSSYSDIYDNSIHWVDANLGTVVAALQDEELMERTILMVASDHGEAFYEHRYEGHARDLYRETTHVPLVIALPFRLKQPIYVQEPVENIDIWPTLLDLAGLPELPGAEGRSLVPAILSAARGETGSNGAAPRFAQLDRTWGRRGAEPEPLVSVQEGRYRLFQPVAGPGRPELYDAVEDPGEQKDLASERPEDVERLQGLVDEYMASPEAVWGSPEEVPLSDLMLGQLRALGYVLDDDEEPPAEETPPGEPLE